MKIIKLVALLFFTVSFANAKENRLAGIKSIGNTIVFQNSLVEDDFGVKLTPCFETHQKPASFLWNISLGYLQSDDIEGFHTWDSYGDEYITEDASAMWTMQFGCGINTTPVDVDIMLGPGFFVHNDFIAGFIEFSVAPRFNIGQHIKLGPYLSTLYVGNGHWDGVSEINLEGGRGSRLGLSFCAGGEKAMFKLDVTHLDFAFDVEADDGWFANNKELDLSGTLIQMGVYFRF